MSSAVENQFALAVTQLFARLNSDYNNYVVWGGYQQLPHAIAGSDIDLVVDEISGDFAQVMGDLGFVRARRCCIFGGTPAVFVKYVPDAGQWLPVHVIRYVTPSAHRIAPENFLDYSVMRDGIRVCLLELELAITLAHSIWKEKITEKRRLRIEAMLKNEQLDRARLAGILTAIFGSADLGEQLFQYPVASLFATSAQSKIYKDLSYDRRLMCYRKLNTLKGYIFRFKNKHGRILAVSGLDGAGKSTLIDRLGHHSGTKCPLYQIRSMAVRCFPEWIQRIRNVWRDSSEQPGALHRLIYKLLTLPQLILDYISVWILYLEARHMTWSGHNVMFDRYAIFHAIKRVDTDSSHWLYRCYMKISEWLFIVLFPKPDIFIFFEIKPEEALSRKQEDTLLKLRRVTAAYQRLLTQYNIGKKHLVVDAARTTDELQADILECIWRDLVCP